MGLFGLSLGKSRGGWLVWLLLGSMKLRRALGGVRVTGVPE